MSSAITHMPHTQEMCKWQSSPHARSRDASTFWQGPGLRTFEYLHIYIYIYIHTYIHIMCMYVCAYIYIYTHIMRTFECQWTWTSVPRGASNQTSLRRHAQGHSKVHMCVYIYIYIYIIILLLLLLIIIMIIMMYTHVQSMYSKWARLGVRSDRGPPS